TESDPHINVGVLNAASGRRARPGRGLLTSPQKTAAGTMAGLPRYPPNSPVPSRFGQMARLGDVAPGGWGAENSEALYRTGPRGKDPKGRTPLRGPNGRPTTSFGRKGGDLSRVPAPPRTTGCRLTRA